LRRRFTPGSECGCTKHTTSGPEEIVESDIRIRHHLIFAGGTQEEWYTTNHVPEKCNTNPNFGDLEGVMTHERGHSVGIDHVEPIDDHPNLTMSRRPDNCDREYRDLAKGDVRGLQRIYGT
jgi:hypothetical protein